RCIERARRAGPGTPGVVPPDRGAVRQGLATRRRRAPRLRARARRADERTRLRSGAPAEPRSHRGGFRPARFRAVRTRRCGRRDDGTLRPKGLLVMSGALDGRTPPPGSILSMTSRIYIDITTSVRWRRPPVGIVRIEREFARHCLRHEPDTVFCELDASGTYRALAAERVRAILDDAWCSANPGEAAANPVAAAPPT